ncbi:MAG: tetratricopeptide repeat protein [Bacteroidaceae bacterium]|nr:tetratricopeptide repeat protein [Bacteroidaceae bacterium]
MKRIKLLIISALICVLSNAQTLQQGRNYFLQGDYEKAKPIMLKYLKQKPDDASRNYWYGICCMETGEKDKAIPYLEKAAAKKIFKAYRALGEYYLEREDYQPAITNLEAFVKGISSDKELHDAALEDSLTHATDSLKVLFRMLRNTSRVCFIDSFRVSKNELFSTYIIGESTGSFYPSSAFFEDDSEGEVFLPETGQNILYSRMTPQGVFRFYTKFKSFDRWTDETPVSGLETDGDLRYPFLQNDGVTIYYAASGSESMGGLDIFVSRYNTATGKYLKPENIGMPFNSEANDYLYVIDEDNNLGWFATDRRQPKDTVCVYVFIPNERNQKFNYEDGDTLAIHRAARLTSIAETQSDLLAVRSARQRLTLLRYELAEKSEQGSFTYIIDDFTTYHNLDDFKCPDAAKLYQRWTELKHQYETDLAKLNKQRDDYADASRQEKERMTSQLLEFEDKVLKTEQQVIKMENDIRTTEINYLNR